MEMDYRTDNIIELSWLVGNVMSERKIGSIDSNDLKQLIVRTAEKFETIHDDSDWYDLDYVEEITKRGNLELAKMLWDDFEDVPMNPDTECIEEEWCGFSAGTFREDIWHWFEERFDVSVAEDLMCFNDNEFELDMIDGVTTCCGYDFGTDKKRAKFCPVCGKKLVDIK